MSLSESTLAEAGASTNAAEVANTATAENFGHLALASIMVSPTNPRTSIPRGWLLSIISNPVAAENVLQMLRMAAGGDRAAYEQLVKDLHDDSTWAEMALSVYTQGVNQPVLVRRLPAQLMETEPGVYVPHTDGDMPAVVYELIAGERRYWASRLAGLDTIPALIKAMTDEHVLAFQLVENLQRKDLDPLEEAEGYAKLIAATGIRKEDIAARIGKSRSHVYERLQLLQAPAAVKAALRDGQIMLNNALFIARLPSPKLQQKALDSLASNHIDLEDGGKRSVRKIREFLKEKFTLNLSEAIFDVKDAQLLENAGACTECPKRSGNSPLHTDLAAPHEKSYHGMHAAAPNLCTDPDCFDAKKKAHLKNKAAALEAKGKVVIQGAKARATIGADGSLKNGFIALKDVKADLAKKGDKAAGVQVVVVQDPRTGKTVEAVKADDVKAVGVKVKAAPSGGRDTWKEQYARQQAEQEERHQQFNRDLRANLGVLAEIRRAASLLPRSEFDLRIVAKITLDGTRYEGRSLLAALHGYEGKGHDALTKAIDTMSMADLATLMLDCALVEAVYEDSHDTSKASTTLKGAAKHYGVDMAEIRKAVAKLSPDVRTQDLLAGIATTAGEAPAGAGLKDAGQKPAEPDKPAKKNKRNPKGAPAAQEADTQLGIADAMQDDEAAPAAGAAVQLVPSLAPEALQPLIDKVAAAIEAEEAEFDARPGKHKNQARKVSLSELDFLRDAQADLVAGQVDDAMFELRNMVGLYGEGKGFATFIREDLRALLIAAPASREGAAG